MNFKAHFDFKTNPPSLTYDSKIENIYILGGGGYKFNTAQTSNTISTRSGRLAMYSDGETIWDSTHNVMQNGTDLKGSKCNNSAHNSVFVPLDLDSTLYYFFTVANTIQDGCYFGLPNRDSVIYYHIIDLSKNDGKGAVVSKNNRLNSFFSDNVVAVKHRNGVDTWIATRDKLGSSCVAWLLTPCGISSPIISKTFGYSSRYDRSQLQFSSNGKLAAFYTYLDTLPYLNYNKLILNPSFNQYSKLQSLAINILEFDDSSGVFIEKKKSLQRGILTRQFASHLIQKTLCFLMIKKLDSLLLTFLTLAFTETKLLTN